MAKFWTSFKRAYRGRTLGDVEQSGHNFEMLSFRDNDRKPCTLCQSSLAIFERPGTSALRLGVDGARMHLTRHQVEALINHLESWLDYGTLEVRR